MIHHLAGAHAAPSTDELNKRAIKGDAQALKALQDRFKRGDAAASDDLGTMYFDGNGVRQDYDAAAHWFGCPTPDKAILGQCRAGHYSDLPPQAVAILTQLKCDITDDANAEVHSVNLDSTGAKDYTVCCHEPSHGPCGAVILGKIAGKWRNLARAVSLFGSFGCESLMPLETQHNGYHDVCLPSYLSPMTPFVRGGPNYTEVWQFRHGSYREARNPLADSPR
jgi:hypothetical protein